MPFFSVVIPVYNASETLRQTLDSVAFQTFTDFEVVIVNDGSKDNSLAIIKQWIAQNPELSVNLISQRNHGLGASRNTAVGSAKGDYIAFLDADDIWKKKKLKKCYNFLKFNPNTHVLYHKAISIGLQKSRIRYNYQLNGIEDLLVKGNPLIPSATVINKIIFEDFEFSNKPDFHGAEDLFLWLELMEQQADFQFLPEPLTLYRETGGMSNRLDEHLEKVFNVLDHFRQKGSIGEAHIEKARQRKYYEAARFYHKRRKFALAAAFYQKHNGTSLKKMLLRWLCRFKLGI